MTKATGLEGLFPSRHHIESVVAEAARAQAIIDQYKQRRAERVVQAMIEGIHQALMEADAQAEGSVYVGDGR